jgi:hypothetical protein
MKRSALILSGLVLLAGTATLSAQDAQTGPGYGPYWNQMPMHQGYGYGPGYGHGYGPGYGRGWGHGWGPGWGPMMRGGQGPWATGPGWRGQHMPGRGRFAMIDANEDGVITAEEAASAADDVFTAMDADDDGMLTKEEYMSVRMGPQLGRNPERQQQRQAAKEARFDEMDQDGDGSITKAEFLTLAEKHHMSADADKDGKITPWEHRRRNWN